VRSPPLTFARWESDGGVHEMATREGAGGAAGRVRRYAGYDERAPAQTRREVAKTGISLVLALGDPLVVTYEQSKPEVLGGAFVLGTQLRAALTSFSGHQHGVQVDLTPAGARGLLGVGVGELTDRITPLGAVLGRRGEELVERLAATPSWSARFDLLDRTVGATCAGPELAPEVRWLWRQLADRHGNCRVEQLMDETGRSRRHVASQFRQQVGVSPKTCARLLRFERAVNLLRSRSGPTSLAGVAVAAGYYDQPHFNRDVRAFAGCTPSELMVERAVAPEISFLQDERRPVAIPLPS
jgi:AraC-like DNA-binding protein